MAFFGSLRFGHWGKIIAWPEGGISLFIFLCVGIYCMFLSIGGLKHFAGGRPALVHSEWTFCLSSFFFFAFSASSCFL